MSKIIIFTGSTGAGHTLAAQSLKEALDAKGHDVKIIDAFQESGKLIGSGVEKGYKDLVEKMPAVYRKMYEKFDQPSKTYDIVFSSARHMMQKQLLSHIEDEKPDLIVSTHPIVTNVLGQLKQEGKLDYPILAFVTDYKIHEVYLNPTIDAYVVASDYTKETMAGKGIETDRIYPYGIPTRSVFKERHKSENHQGLHILLMGGSLGAQQILNALKALLKIEDTLSISVVCGKNQKLEKQIERYLYEHRTDGKEVHVYGFVDNISELMDQADLIITKPGGLTTSEAIMKNIPMVIPYAYPGQEEENAQYLVSSGMAMQLDKPKELTSIIDFLIHNNYIIDHMREAMKEESTKYSIDNTVSLCESLIKSA